MGKYSVLHAGVHPVLDIHNTFGTHLSFLINCASLISTTQAVIFPTPLMLNSHFCSDLLMNPITSSAICSALLTLAEQIFHYSTPNS